MNKASFAMSEVWKVRLMTGRRIQRLASFSLPSRERVLLWIQAMQKIAPVVRKTAPMI